MKRKLLNLMVAIGLLLLAVACLGRSVLPFVPAWVQAMDEASAPGWVTEHFMEGRAAIPLQDYQDWAQYLVRQYSNGALMAAAVLMGLGLLQYFFGFGAVLYNLAASLILLELFFHACFTWPVIHRYWPGEMQEYMRNFYMNSVRKIIQWDPACAEYDSELDYILKPGRCRFNNPEFRTELRINSRGLRDDEDSLYQPEIIVIGDSHSVGWGVQHEETYADLIEKATGIKTLNAAVPSYGTVREMKILNRLDLSRLRYLILQYNESDTDESMAFYDEGNRLEPVARSLYESEVAEYLRYVRYVPGKYAKIALQAFAESWDAGLFETEAQKNAVIPPPSLTDAEYFLNVLSNLLPEAAQKAQLIFFQGNTYGEAHPEFLEDLRKKIEEKDYPEPIENMILLDSSKFLFRNHYYFLDDHPNAEGHRAAARALTQAIQGARPL